MGAMRILRKRDFSKKVTSGRSGALRFVILVAKNKEKRVAKNDEEPETFIVLLEGDMDKNAIPFLRKAISPLFEKKDAVQLIVDLSKLSHVDSAGIATLLDWFQQSKRENLRFTLAGLIPEVQALLEMEHLKGVFEVVPPLQWVIG
jgi:anti-sigma B factor antagonist